MKRVSAVLVLAACGGATAERAKDDVKGAGSDISSGIGTKNDGGTLSDGVGPKGDGGTK